MKRRSRYTHVEDTGILSPFLLKQNMAILNVENNTKLCNLREISQKIQKNHTSGMDIENVSPEFLIEIRDAKSRSARRNIKDIVTTDFKCVPFCTFMHLGSCVNHYLIVGKHCSCIYAEDVSPYVKTSRNIFRTEIPEDLSNHIAAFANSKPQAYLFDIPREENDTGIDNIIHLGYFCFLCTMRMRCFSNGFPTFDSICRKPKFERNNVLQSLCHFWKHAVRDEFSCLSLKDLFHFKSDNDDDFGIQLPSDCEEKRSVRSCRLKSEFS